MISMHYENENRSRISNVIRLLIIEFAQAALFWNKVKQAMAVCFVLYCIYLQNIHQFNIVHTSDRIRRTSMQVHWHHRTI